MTGLKRSRRARLSTSACTWPRLASSRCFCAASSRAPRPLIQLRLLRNPQLSAGVVANGIAHSSMLATGLLLPFLLERGQGYTPNETQQVSLVMTFSLIVGSLGGGWLYSRTGSPAIGVLSIGAIAGGLSVLGWVGADLPYANLFPVVALLGAGLGVFTAVNNTSVMTAVSSEQRGFASGMVETTRQLGHSLGVSISSGVLQASLAAAAIPTLGYRAGFSEAATVMGLVAAAGVVVVLYPQLSRRRRDVCSHQLRDKSGVGVSAGDDHTHARAVELKLVRERERDWHRARRLHEQLQPQQQIAHRLEHFGIRHRLDRVREALDNRKRQSAGLLRANAVRDRVGRRNVHRLACRQALHPVV